MGLPDRKPSSETEQFLCAVLESIQDGISVLDTDLTIRFTNSVMERWYSHELPFKGKKCYEVYHNSDHECAVCPTLRCLKSKQVEMEIVPGPPIPEAPIRWLELYSYPILDGEQVTGVVEFVRDITAREQAREELRVAQERMRQFMDASPDLYFLKDLAGHYLFVNAANANFFGLPEEKILGKTDFELMPNREAAEMCVRSDEQALATMDMVFSQEKVGEKVYEIRKFPVVAEGKLLGIGGIARDVTDRVIGREKEEALERRLQQAERLESIGRLAGGVAHDYNNMLAVIITYAELGLKEEGVPNRLRGYLRQILAAAERSRDVTHQLLAFASRQTVRPRVIDLNKTVEDSLGMLRRLIGEHIDLVWRPSAVCPKVNMDPIQIHQVLTNLCVNARDAICVHGTIFVETEAQFFRMEDIPREAEASPGEYVVLSVTDTGKGIPAHLLDKIFEPFFTTKPVGEGTGLGLATVYGIVKQNKGFIHVLSEVNQGTTFKIHFPATVKTPTAEQETITFRTVGKGAGELILVVEDEPALLTLYDKLLTSLGYRIIAASTPTEALEHVRRSGQPIDLVVTDISLPEMNGYELLKRIREQYPEIKCLFTSGYSENFLAQEGGVGPASDFISKPFTVDDFGRKIRHLLEGEPRTER